jgi:hypothetical protein
MGPDNQGDDPHGNSKLNIYAYLDEVFLTSNGDRRYL